MASKDRNMRAPRTSAMEKERKGRGEGKHGWREAEEQSHRFKLKSGNTREGETFAGLSGLITPGTGFYLKLRTVVVVVVVVARAPISTSSIFFFSRRKIKKVIHRLLFRFIFLKFFVRKFAFEGATTFALSIFISLVLLNSRFDDN